MFGTAKIQAGTNVLTDPQADFSKLDRKKYSNLHVLWGFGNTGVYRIARVIDRHRVEIEPSFNVSEEVRYSIGSNLYSKFRVSNSDFFLLDTREAGCCDLGYFGLVPEAIGRGLGRFLLETAVHAAWDLPGVERLTVNTCSLDHPRALPLYQRAGFVPVRREERSRIRRAAPRPGDA